MAPFSLLIGVLIEDTPNLASRLTASPITALLADPEAASVLSEHDVPTAAAPIRSMPATRACLVDLACWIW
jgi:transposase